MTTPESVVGPRVLRGFQKGPSAVTLTWASGGPSFKYELEVAYGLGQTRPTDFNLVATVDDPYKTALELKRVRDGAAVPVIYRFQSLAFTHGGLFPGAYAYRVRGVYDSSPPHLQVLSYGYTAYSQTVVVHVEDLSPEPAPGVIVTPPGAQPLQFVAPFRYWRFQTLDGTETYTFEMNPNQADPALAERQLGFNHSPVPVNGQRYTANRGPRAPISWSFGGTVRTKAQRDAFLTWLNKRSKIKVITDLGEVHIVRMVSYSPDEKGGRGEEKVWRQTYTISTLLYDEVRP